MAPVAVAGSALGSLGKRSTIIRDPPRSGIASEPFDITRGIRSIRARFRQKEQMGLCS